MGEVKWNKKDGIVDARTGTQLLQILASNCSQKYRDMAGKELANKLNSVVRGRSLAKKSNAPGRAGAASARPPRPGGNDEHR